MNTKAEQNSQKGTKNLNSNNYSKQGPGKFMDNILSNMKTLKTHIKKTHQTSSNGLPLHQSNLEPEYLNNILIDINDVDKFKNKSKVSVLRKSADKSPAKKFIADNIALQESKNAQKFANVVQSELNKTEKRPKSSIKRRLKKLIEYNKQSKEDDNRKTQATSTHLNKQKKITKKETANVQISKEETSTNVQQISNPEQSIINNTLTSIAENNKREPKHKKNKKDSKTKVLKEKNATANPDLLENDKKTVKCKQKPKSKQKNTISSNTPQAMLVKTQSQQSKKIKLIVNQITSNLKQSSCFELKSGNIKRDIYIKGLSSCMTSQALEQINRILNPPRVAAYKANYAATKNKALVKTNRLQNITLEEISRPTTSQLAKNHLSKINIANEINTFNKTPQLSPILTQITSSSIENDAKTKKTKDLVGSSQVLMQKDFLPMEKESKTVMAENTFTNLTPSIMNEEQELIKKINEKLDKIITSGLKEFDTHTTSSTSLKSKFENKNTPELQPPQPPPPTDHINLKAKNKEPAKFMQALNNTNALNHNSTARTSLSTPTNKTNREPRANESPPPQTQAQIREQQNLTNILKVVRNSEIVNNIKQNTLTALQNTFSKSMQLVPADKTKVSEKKLTNANEQTKTTTNNNEHESGEKTTKNQEVIKTVPTFKKIQLSSENLTRPLNFITQKNKLGLLNNAEKASKQSTSLNTARKPSKNITPNISTSNAITTGNRPTVTTTHLCKNISITNTGTSSSSTLNLLAALSTSKKFNLLSPMEIVQDFVNLVNLAKRNRKTFTICGNFYSLRRAFAERGWVEKMRINIMEDRETWRKIENLSNFELVDGMRNKEHGEKYRRVFLTKLLAGHQVDFYWDYLTNPFAVNNDKIKRTLINRFPYGATRAYTSKYGLTDSLRDAHWYCIDGYANILYPRTYNLSMIEEMTSFIEDFRITAVISLLQWIVSNMATPEKILSNTGDVPTSVYNFATIQCHNFIKIKENRDIDEVIPQAKDYEWEVFLEKYYRIVHNENCFKMNERISAELMIEQSKYVLKKVKKYLPNLHLDGYKNMWLLKPNNGSRGSGIHVCRTLKYMMDTVNNRKDIKYVVQKYLERPLLIHKTKFDIRQWFLVTCMPNVKVWLYKECYLRFSSQMFDLNKLHESIHLTNNSIQCRYKNNNQRSTNLPEQNMWDSETFKKYLTEIGQPYAWRNNIYKGMKECLIALFMLCQSKMELRINSFELCGADFMLSEDYHPYLIEINSRPALYPSTKITARMCPKVLEDVIKVTVDHARNPKASTGDFELIYTDSFNYAIPRNVNNLYIEGMSYFSKFIEKKPSTNLYNTIVPIPQMKEVKHDSIKRILNIDPGVVKIDVRNTLEKILAVVHNDSDSKIKESSEERNKKFRSMLSEFVSIISNVKNVNEEV